MLRPVSQRSDQIRVREIAQSALPFALAIAVAAVIIGIQFPIDAVLLTAPLAGLLVILYPVLLPLGLVASVPVQDVLPVPGDAPITATRLMLAGTAAMIPLILLRQRAIHRSRFLLLILVLMSVMAMSLWNAVSLTSGYSVLYHWLVAGVAFWLCIQFIRTRHLAISAFVLVSILAAAQGIYGGAQAILGIGPVSFQIGTDISRAFGTFGMPNSYAAYLETVTLPLLPVALWAITYTWDRLGEYRDARLYGYLASGAERRRLLVAIVVALVLSAGFVIGLAGIALSFSRGGWLGTIAALAVMVVLLGRRVLVATTLLALVLSIVLMVSAPGAVLTVIGDRFTQIADQIQIGDIRGVPVTPENFAAMERMAHWQTAIAMWDAHPWLGVGAGNFNEQFPEYAIHPQFDESQGHAHNYYLHLLAETGILGLGAYLVFLTATFVIGWRAFRRPDLLARAIGIGAIGLSVALTVHNVFENLHVLNISVQMMLIWALALIAVNWRGDDARSASVGDSSEHLQYDSSGDTGRQRPLNRYITVQE
jgi:putative inorganic carbon (hco3(-)) transporter